MRRVWIWIVPFAGTLVMIFFIGDIKRGLGILALQALCVVWAILAYSNKGNGEPV
jgi:hypothetical protein